MQQFIEFAANNIVLFAMLIVILALLVRSYIVTAGAKGVSPLEAIRIANSESATLLDVRTQVEYEEGHVLNAINIPLGNLESRVGEIKDHKESTLILICQSGNRSGRAGSILKKHGFQKLYNLNGGMLAWRNANLPLSKQSRGKSAKHAEKSTAVIEAGETSAESAGESDVVVYTQRHCTHCAKVLRLLKKKGVAFREISVDETPDKRREMIDRAGKDTVPQVFIGDRHIGGCDEMYRLDREGELDSILGLVHA